MEVAGRLCQVCESLLDEFEELKKEINSLWSDFSFINSGFSARTDSERVIQIIHRKGSTYRRASACTNCVHQYKLG